MKGHEGPVLAVRFTKQGNYCLSCGKDRSIRLWNPHKGVAIKTYAGHSYDVRDVAVVQDNSKFSSCGGDRQILHWDVSTGQIIRRYKGHDAIINTLCYGPEDAVLVSGSYDSYIKVWDARTRSMEAMQSIKGAADSVTTVLLNDRAELYASSVDGTVRRFDVRMGRLVTDEVGAPVTHMALSHDNECVLAACTDGVMRLLDRGSGQLLAQYTGHVHSSYKIECALMPSDAYVLAASEDGRVCYWDLVEAQQVLSFQAHASVVCSLTLHPLGQSLLTASVDGSITVWT